MEASATSTVACRTCGRPRGATVGQGTRCAECARRHALFAWFAISASAGVWAASILDVPGSPLVPAIVTFLVLPPAAITVVAAHELAHALLGKALGFVVVRIEIGEGRELLRFGRSPELVLGAVPGSGWTHAAYLGRGAYRWRWVAFLLSGPAVSVALAAAASVVSHDWPVWARTVAVVVAFLSAALAVVTLLPVATFGGRVWSDLALVLAAARMAEDELDVERVARGLELVQTLVGRGETAAAVGVAEKLRAGWPQVPLTWSVLVFARAGRDDDAERSAREALAETLDEDTRGYLSEYLEWRVTQTATS